MGGMTRSDIVLTSWRKDGLRILGKNVVVALINHDFLPTITQACAANFECNLVVVVNISQFCPDGPKMTHDNSADTNAHLRFSSVHKQLWHGPSSAHSTKMINRHVVLPFIDIHSDLQHRRKVNDG